MRRLFLSSSLSLFVAAGSAGGAPAPLNATFLQLQAWMLEKMTAADWDAEMKTMKDAGVDTVILQWLKYDTVRFYPVHAPTLDPVETILKFADANAMKVHLGLSFDSSWWAEADNPAFLKSAAERVAAFAGKLQKRYGQHPSFVGWYIPYEIGDTDYDDDEAAALGKFFRTIADGCRKAAVKEVAGKKEAAPAKKEAGPSPAGNEAKKVAASFFFSGKLPPAAGAVVAGKILKDAKLDVVIVQDGVGANRWDDQIRAKVAPHLTALAEVIRKSGAQPWAAIEIFATTAGTDTRVPASGTRVAEQLAVAGPLVERSVMFDFFHYMSPRRGTAQQTLHDWFRKR